MKKKNIYFLSASDRLNFGDLLFPIIFKSFLNKSDYDFKNYGLVKSNLEHFGALRTESYRALIRDMRRQKGIIIIGGGEVLFPNWYTLYSYINPQVLQIFKNQMLNRFENKYNLFKKFLFGSDNLYPFTPIKETNSKIIYNSVGGVFDNNISRVYKKKLSQRLRNSDYLSVRDIRSKNNLESNEIGVSLTPDSALIISDIITVKKAKSELSININKFPADYILLQMGLGKTPQDKKKFIKNLLDLANKNNLKVIACPLGLASGHEDDKVLAEFARICPQIELFNPGNLYDIIYLISQANFYLGTSLHGLITAQSFKTPFFPLNPSIEKLSSYIQTWCSRLIKNCIDYDEINKIDNLYRNWDYKEADAVLLSQKKLVYQNFERIFKIINT